MNENNDLELLKPTMRFRWRELSLDETDLRTPTALGFGWEGMRSYYVLEQKFIDAEGGDVWKEVEVLLE